MLTKIHHVGVVVRSADEALKFYRDTLGLSVSKDEVIADQGVRGVLLPAGESEIELLEPVREGTGVARFLEKGEGMHHVCFESTDVAQELEAAAAKGLQLIDKAPRPGLAGMIGFLHPKATGGVLVEFATPPAGEAHHAAGNGMVRGFDHLVVATPDLDGAASTWVENFSLAAYGRGELPNLGIKNVLLKVGDAKAFVEIVAPLGDETPVGKFVAERGAGMYLISLEVAALDDAVAKLRAAGVRVGDPVGGPGSNRLAFISPRNTHGVSIQLMERAAGA
jgi:methylmalonyl-CoA/ethylmalonyl-CoA epimerase